MPFMQDIFHTGSINFVYGWIIPSITGLIVLIVTELVKVVRLVYSKKASKSKI